MDAKSFEMTGLSITTGLRLIGASWIFECYHNFNFQVLVLDIIPGQLHNFILTFAW
jgi:hypothetical protein